MTSMILTSCKAILIWGGECQEVTLCFRDPKNSEAWKVALAEQLELQFLETKNALGQKVLNPRPPLSLDPQALYQLSYVPFSC